MAFQGNDSGPECESFPKKGPWEYTGKRDVYGYGRIFSGNRELKAHRVFYEAWIEAVPEGLFVRHGLGDQACTLSRGRHMDDHVISGRAAARNNGGFTAKDMNLYRYPCEVLQTRGLPLQAQYTVANMARVFDCDIRVILDPIHSKKAAPDFPFFEKRLATALFGISRQYSTPELARSCIY